MLPPSLAASVSPVLRPRSRSTRAMLLRPQHRREPLAVACEQRQSVLRSAIPHVQIPPGVSGSIRLSRRRPRHLPRSLRVVQRRASSQRPELSHAGRRALRPRGHHPQGPPPRAPGRLRRSSRAICEWAATTRNPAHSGVDQSAAENDPPACHRNGDRHPERPAAWGDRRATLDRWRSTDLARQQRAVAASGVGSRSTMPDQPDPRLRDPTPREAFVTGGER